MDNHQRGFITEQGQFTKGVEDENSIITGKGRSTGTISFNDSPKFIMPSIPMEYDPFCKICWVKTPFEFELTLKKYTISAGDHYGKYRVSKPAAEKINDHENLRIKMYKDQLGPSLEKVEDFINSGLVWSAGDEESCFKGLQTIIDLYAYTHPESNLNEATRRLAISQAWIGLYTRLVDPLKDPVKQDGLNYIDYSGPKAKTIKLSPEGKNTTRWELIYK